MSRRTGGTFCGTLVVGLALLWAQPVQAQPAEAQPPPKSLKRGLKLYGQKQYLNATVMLHRTLKGTDGTEAHKQQAQFFIAKALYHKRFYAASFIYFSAIVTAGSRHKYWKSTLIWLAALQTKLSPRSGILD